MPFGEEIAVNENNRQSALGYNYGSTTRQAFTGYEKDTETNLEFAQNRYYSNKHGRFTSVDPIMASGKARNPQTWNRYVYVRNNPLNLTDPLGLDDCDPKKELCVDGKPVVGVVTIKDDSHERSNDLLLTGIDVHKKNDGNWFTRFIKKAVNEVEKFFGFEPSFAPSPTIPPPTFDPGLDPFPPNPGDGSLEPVPPNTPPDANSPNPTGGSDNPDLPDDLGGFSVNDAKVLVAKIGYFALMYKVRQWREAQKNPNKFTVRRFMSKSEYKIARKSGIFYDSSMGNGIPTTTRKFNPRNQSIARQRTGARSAEYYIDYDVTGLARGPDQVTRGGLPEYQIKDDLTTDRIITCGAS